MRVLVDANILLDVASKRELFREQSERVLTECAKRDIELLVSWHTISNLWYIVRKESGKDVALTLIEQLAETTTIASGGGQEVLRALELGFNDFEDALQASVAESFGADVIVTRNEKDFGKSPVEAMSPEKFLSKL